MALANAQRRDDIQGLRAIAVLVVIAFHATPVVPGGFVGVDIFFVISGFVITLMLQREQQKHGRIRLGQFYVRRFKRLTPALTLVISFTMIGSALLLSPLGAQQTAATTAIGALLLAANVAIVKTTGGYFDQAAELNPLLHTWSLSVEEQFYLLFPVLLTACWFLARRGGWRRFIPIVVIAAVGTVSLLLAVVESLGVLIAFVPDLLIGFYGPATRVWEFAIGALLALGAGHLAPRSTRSATLAAVIGVTGVFASLWLITPETPSPGPWTLLPVLSTGILLISGMRPNPVARVLALGPMVGVGDLSYSLYLWHWPFIVFSTLLCPGSTTAPLVAAVLSTVPAWASYRFLEQPVRQLDVGGVRLIALVAAALLPPMALAGAIRYAADNDYWNETVRAYRAAIKTPHLSSTNPAGCTDKAWETAAECTWNAELEGAPVYLVGDSNADHFSEAVVEAGRSLGRPVVIMAQIGCTFVDVHLYSIKPWVADRCNSYVSKTTDVLVDASPGTVVIANSYLWWGESSGITLGLSETDVTGDPVTKLGRLSAGLEESVRALQDAGHQVVVVQAVPHWGDGADSMTWAGCSVRDMLDANCHQEFPLSEAESRQGAVWQVVADVAQRTDSALMDFSADLCPGGVCESMTSDGLMRYRDATHLTVQQSQALAPEFLGILG